MKKIIVLLSLLLLLLGCKSTKVETIPGGEWETYALIKDGIYQEIAISFIEFEGKGSKRQVHGNAGVNLFNGVIRIEGNSFKTDDFAMTKMMGPAPVLEFEDLFMQTLQNAESYEITGGILVIKAPSQGLELQFRQHY